MKNLILGLIFISAPAMALDGPANFNFNGNLLDSGTGNPIAGPVTVKFQIYDPAGACLLFGESRILMRQQLSELNQLVRNATFFGQGVLE